MVVAHAVLGRTLSPAPGALATEIARVFDCVFGASHNAVMTGGAEEPLYVPASGGAPAMLFFTRDHAASALHEAAHWCIAGRGRRERVDYGYRYVLPPRTEAQRAAFFAAEVAVQALESVFAACVGLQFRISADDFSATTEERREFSVQVRRRALAVAQHGLPPRAALFADALQARFRRSGPDRGALE